MRVPHEASDLVAIVSLISGFGGIAYHMWKDDIVSIRQWVGATGISMITGGLVFFWLWEPLNSSPTKLMAVSILAGVGGTTVLDLLLTVFKRRFATNVEE